MELSLDNLKNKIISYYELAKEKVKNFYYDFPNLARSFWSRLKVNNIFQLTVILLVICILAFGYSLITNSFTTPFGGDFTLQGMTFIYNGYDDWKEYFRTGIFPTWDTSGFMGVSNIAANSFYYLFDPFFLLLLLFPRSFLLQAQTLIMFLKIILAGVFFYLFLNEFKMKETTKKMGAIAYAFSGWTMFYLWFFHFQEIATIFPLMLLGVEKVIKKRDPRVLIAGLTLMALVNYFFFFSMTVLAFLYAVFRWLQTWKTRSLDENYGALGAGFLGFFSGVLISGFILVPCVLMDLNMPRFANSSYLEDLFAIDGIMAKLKYMFTWPENKTHHILYPLVSLFFMNDSCFEEPLFNTSGYDNVSSSIYIFVPLTLMIIPSLIDACKKKQWGQIVAFLLVGFMLFTPFTYYLLHAFAQAYGRWELFVVALLILFVTTHFDDVTKMKRYVLDISFVVVIAMMIVTATLALGYAKDDTISGLKPIDYMQKVIIPCQFIWVTACYVVMRLRMQKSSFNKDMLMVVALEAVVMGNVTVQGQGTVDYDRVHGGMKLAREQTRLVNELKDYDDSFYRVFNSQADRGNTNLSMFEGYNGVAAFHSVYNFDSKDFIDWSRIAYSYGNWSMGNHEKRYNLDEFMGIKYYLLKKGDTNIPFGYTEVGTLEDCPDELKKTLYPYNENSNFSLYVNNNFIDTFFVFDNYVSSSEMKHNYSANQNEYNYLKTAIIDDEYLESEDSLSLRNTFDKASRSNMDYVRPVVSRDLTYYRANWDSREQGGQYRSYDANMSNADYEAKFGKDPYINRYNTPEYFFTYPSDTMGKYGDTVYYHNGRNTIEENESERGAIQNKLTFNSKVYYDAPKPIARDAKSRNGAYVSVDCPLDYNVALYLYGDDGEGGYKLLANDRHMHNGYSKSGYTWKKSRGFYVTEPVTRIVAIMKDDMKNASYNFYNPFEMIHWEYNDDYQRDVDKLKENASSINITYRDNNEIRFDSNFDDNKIVVTNIPYDKGWKVSYELRDEETGKVSNIDVPTFKAHGGFVGFTSYDGYQQYTLKYETPGFKFGAVLTIGGLTLASCLYAIYISNSMYVKMMRKIKEATSLS